MPINENDLGNFYGTENWHRWSPLVPNMLLTDGALFVAEHGGQSGSFWLMDAIASHQPRALKNPRLRDFQVWILKVNPDKSAVLTCQSDSGVPPFITQNIEYTDFDLKEIKLWVEPMDEKRMVILLPSEH